MICHHCQRPLTKGETIDGLESVEVWYRCPMHGAIAVVSYSKMKYQRGSSYIDPNFKLPEEDPEDY